MDKKRGPRVDVDVPSLLLDTAEAMFGEESWDGLSLRSVARRAGVAPAAVTYHFATKTDLLAAVFQRRATGVGDDARRRLTEVLEEPGEVDARQLVEAVLQPFLTLINESPTAGRAWMSIFARLALANNPIYVAEMNREPNLASLYVATVFRFMPPTPATLDRCRIAMLAMVSAMSSSDHFGGSGPIGADGIDPAFVENLISFIAAGLAGSAETAKRPRRSGRAGTAK
ncbi:MAG: TetR family transcriptional regulator [Mycobacterium sp.]